MFKSIALLAFIIIVLINLSNSWARSTRVNQVPNGQVFSYANCQVDPDGGEQRNDFSLDVQTNFLDGSGDVIWSYALAMLDSDEDGIPNGVKLKGTNVMWSAGNPAPGLRTRFNNPGAVNSMHGNILTVQFSGMNPHLGQRFYIRVVDKYNREEVNRNSLVAIPSADFQIFLDGITPGHSYWVDFYADHNGDGEYDPPTNDHAWRLNVDNVPGDTIVTFTHNTNFTDIEWPYLATVDFVGMTPHVGQKFEIRLINRKTRTEIIRKSLAAIESANFSVELPGIEQNEDYWIDFYADHNGNGLYDSPPLDHAWRLELEDVEVDTALSFQHNTNFTDIMWKYEISLQLSNVNPHLNQMFEMRVIDLLRQKEIGRKKIESIALPNFEVSVAGIDTAGFYQVDFYADHNGNGLYDSPPSDHAWRMRTEETNGDAQVMFSHNTNFVNVNWVYLYTLEVSDLTPHLGQKFEMRIVDQQSGKEVGRAHLDNVYNEEFTISAPGIVPNRMYNVDFYADHNQNGIYDAPQTDHAWRITFNSGDDGDNQDSFQHNTNFVDIDWQYLFTLQLVSMNPHLGQLFEMRLIDQNDDSEVGNFHVDEVVAPRFSVPIPGIRLDGNYRADFYADHNGNGSYDAPPTDHAWRETFTNTVGDVTVEFVHNTNFTDISFPTAIADLLTGILPTAFNLEQNYPNPFNPSTKIKFTLPKPETVKIEVYNIIGQKIQILLNKSMPAGYHEVEFNGTNLSSGVYLYKIEAGAWQDVRKMVLIK